MMEESIAGEDGCAGELPGKERMPEWRQMKVSPSGSQGFQVNAFKIGHKANRAAVVDSRLKFPCHSYAWFNGEREWKSRWVAQALVSVVADPRRSGGRVPNMK